jgi:hypothetical protein
MENVPFQQGVQVELLLAWAAEEYVPGEHIEQNEAQARSENVPGLHEVHAVAPKESLISLLTQGTMHNDGLRYSHGTRTHSP